MKSFKTIVVALDLTEMDKAMLHYAKYFDGLSGGESKFYFVHVIPTFVFPTNVKDLVHGITSPGYKLDEMVEATISKELSEVFGKANGNFEIVVREGKPFNAISELTRQVGADLLLVGNKKISEGSGIVSKMIARKVGSAVCFVTENARPDLKNIVVPMDFSPLAVKALKKVTHLAIKGQSPKIHVLHVLDFPPTTQYLTRHYGLLAPDWEARINEAFAVCLKENEIPSESISFTALKNEHFDTAEHIREFASDVDADMIVLGAKGHNSFEDLFLGSVAEKLVSIVDAVPVLIVR